MADNITIKVNELGLRGEPGTDGDDGLMAAASEAEVKTGTASDKAITPQRLAGAGLRQDPTFLSDVAWGVYDSAKRLAAWVGSTGIFGAALAEFDDVLGRVVRSPRLRIESVSGVEQGGLVATKHSNFAALLQDQDGASPFGVNADGSLDMLLDGASRYSGSLFWSDGSYLIEAVLRSGAALHDLYATNLTTGAVAKVTNDAAADFLNPARAGNYAVFTKRVGEKLIRKAALLTGGGVEVPVHSLRSIHVLGDSFVTNDFMAAVKAGLTDQKRAFTSDGVGGSYLREQYFRFHGGTSDTGASSGTVYSGTPQHWDKTLVIMDGGLSDADPVARIAEIVGTLTPACKRWVYVQSGITSTSTPSQVTAKLAIDATIQAAYPNNYCGTYDYIRANGTGSTTGSGGGQVWPANSYADTLHPSTEGNTLLGAVIGDFIDAKGW